MNDSSEIIRQLVAKLSDTSRQVVVDAEISKWVDFTDKKLAVLLFPNITRNMFESWEAFGYVNDVPHFNALQKLGLRLAGSLAMRLANSKIKKKYSIHDEREALLHAVRTWTNEGLRGKNFHGGDLNPDLADVCVYGCLRSIEKMSTFRWLLEQSDRELLLWFNRMDRAIGESSCVSRE